MAKKNLMNFNNAMILLTIIALFVIIKAILVPQSISLEQEAYIVLDTFTNGDDRMSLISQNELIEEKLRDLDEMGYDEVKNELGLKSDFCIYFEDITGNLVKIDDLNLGIGSEKISINGNPCR